MFSFLKKTIKVGVISAVLVGVAGAAAFALIGKERTHAVMGELHGSLLEQIDKQIDDPSALRSQLREMEQEYPERISQVRGDLAELQQEIRGLDRDVAVSERVVALADQDLEQLQAKLSVQGPVASDGNRLVAVSYDDSAYATDRVEVRLQQIRNTRTAYANRAADARHDVSYLRKQELRLHELLAKLEAEQAEFQAQILGLSRQIDAIARNDRLIKLLDKRNRTIEECSRYEAVSLDQITGRLAQITARQEAELDVLATVERATDYEGLARMQIAAEDIEGAHTSVVQDF